VQECGVLVFLWYSDSDFRIVKFMTPDSNFDCGSKKTWTPTPTLSPKSDFDSDSTTYAT